MRIGGLNRYCLFLILVIVIPFFCLGSVNASTVTVCTSGCDYTFIQEAVEGASAGDVITVNRGTYNENVHITKSITLEGEGPRGTVLTSLNSNQSTLNISTDNVVINGFTINGIGDKTPSISLGGSNCEISRTIVNGSHFAIELKKADNNSLHENYLNGAIVVWDSEINTIKDNFIIRPGEDSSLGIVFFTKSRSNHVINNTISVNRHGVFCFDGGNEIIGNTIFGGDTGTKNCDIIINNTLIDNSEFGVEGGRIIDGNTIIGSHEGVHVAGLKNGIIRGNRISGGGWGISMYESGMNNITDNQIFSNSLEGIALFDSSNWNFISNNTVYNNREGIYIDTSSYNEIYENRVFSNQYYGIALGASTKNLVSRNNVSLNPGGISTFPESILWLDRSINEENIFFENNIMENDVGIELRYSKRDIVRRNVFESNEASGIYLNYSDSGFIEDNTIASSQNAIVFHSSFNFSVEGNIMDDNLADILLDEGSDVNLITNNTVTTIQGDELSNRIYNNIQPVEESVSEVGTTDNGTPKTNIYLISGVLAILLVALYLKLKK